MSKEKIVEVGVEVGVLVGAMAVVLILNRIGGVVCTAPALVAVLAAHRVWLHRKS